MIFIWASGNFANLKLSNGFILHKKINDCYKKNQEKEG